MNRFNIFCLSALIVLSIVSLAHTKSIGAQFENENSKKVHQKGSYKTNFNFIFKNGKISGIPAIYLTENAIKLVSQLEKALQKSKISKQKFRFSNEKLSMTESSKKQIKIISEEFNMEGLKQSKQKSSITEKIAMEDKPRIPRRPQKSSITEKIAMEDKPRIPRRPQKSSITEKIAMEVKPRIPRRPQSAKIDTLVSALETEFTIQQREKSFLDIVNFKSYYDDGYGKEKVYYEKGLSTKWIIFIIIIIIVILIIVCCCLFYMGVFNTCSDCLNSESEPTYQPGYEQQQNVYYQQGPPQYYQYEPQYYEEKKYYN